MDAEQLIAHSRPFLEWLNTWYAGRPARPLAEVVSKPRACALLSVDVINGFCRAGPLASPRVGAIVQPIARLMRAAYAAGVRDFAVSEDHHPPDAVEFGQYPPHCMRGTAESGRAAPRRRAAPARFPLQPGAQWRRGRPHARRARARRP
jgi:hypothetical protein